MLRCPGKGRHPSDDDPSHPWCSRYLIPLIILAASGFARPCQAAWAVYADSWGSPTQAQEQAIHINRLLNVESAAYERATVQGKVFWRVKVGVYRTREEALDIRRRLTDARAAETWMREVSEEELPREPFLPVTSQPVRSDTTRADSIARTLMDSLMGISQRRADSLEAATQERLERIVQEIRGQLSQEMLDRIEQSMMRDRQLYVTQAEQAQMTRAILDEMESHFDAVRDSLQREQELHERRAALLPRLNGSVAARAFAAHDRPEGGPILTSGRVLLSQARGTIEWSDDRGEVLIDVRSHDASSIELIQSYALWTISQPGLVTQQIGLGLIETPYGLEPSSWADMLAPSASQLTGFHPANFLAVWLVPYQTERVRLLLLPYGTWNEHSQSGLIQILMTWPHALLELTGTGEQGRNGDGRKWDVVQGHLVARWKGERWYLGLEGLFQRSRTPPNDLVLLTYGVTERVDAWGALALVHRRFSEHWGWTVRGDFRTDLTTWTGGSAPVLPRKPLWRRATATTGPMVFIGERLRLSLMYSLDVSEHRPIGGWAIGRDQSHRVELGMSHAF